MYSVFLVDDEPFIIEGLRSILEWNDYGLQVVGSAENGEEAWEILQLEPADIVISDIMMPLMTGLQLIERMKEQETDTKFIVLSGYNEFQYVKECIKLGIENYLLKPISIEELKLTLENTVEKLDQTRKEKQFEQRNIDILRNNVLYRWVSGNIHTEELQQRAELLQLSLHDPYYLAATLKVQLTDPLSDQDKREQLQMKDQIYARCQWIEQQGLGYAMRSMEGEIVFLFRIHPSSVTKESIVERLKRWIEEIAEELALRISIAFGSLQSSYVEVSTSYGHARKVHEYYLMRPGEFVVDYEELLHHKSMGSKQLQLDLQVFVKLLSGKNHDEFLGYIDEEFTRIQTLEGIHARDIQNYAVELLIQMKQLMKDARPGSDSGESYDNLFSNVFQMHTIDQLKEHVLFVAEKMMAHLKAKEDYSPIIQRVLQHIDERYTEELSLKTLSQMYNMNPVYLGQLFQKEVCETFSCYLNKVRIQKAKELLMLTNDRISDIATQIGYWDKSYFLKQFKKHVGLSPKEYRGLQQ